MFQRIVSNNKDNGTFPYGFYTVVDHRAERMRLDKLSHDLHGRFSFHPFPVSNRLDFHRFLGSGFLS